MFGMSRCSIRKLAKLVIVSLALVATYLLYTGQPKKTRHPILRNDFIDPDTMRRDPVLHKPQDPHVYQSDVIPNVYTFNKPLGFNHTCVPLKVGKISTKICIYGSNLDSMISSHIAHYGTWEGDLLETMADVLKAKKGMHLVDLGCSIGVYTIVAAYMGRKVIAVDPLESNLQLLDKSLKLAKIRDRVVLVHNAISDKSEMVMIDLRMGNIGGTHVNSVPNRRRRSPKRTYNGVNVEQEKPLKRVKRFKRIVKKPQRKKKSVDGKKNQQKRKDQKTIQKKTGQSKVKVANVKPQKTKAPKIKAKDTPALKAIHRDKPKIAKKVGKKPNRKLEIKAGVKKPKKVYDNHLVEKQNLKQVAAITLNDLCKLKTFKPTFVKMDIEGWENKALRNSDLFREAFDVRSMLMEWLFHRNNPRISEIASLMIQNGYLPYKIVSSKNRFESLIDQKVWPDNVYWKKR